MTVDSTTEGLTTDETTGLGTTTEGTTDPGTMIDLGTTTDESESPWTFVLLATPRAPVDFHSGPDETTGPDTTRGLGTRLPSYPVLILVPAVSEEEDIKKHT